MQSLDTITEPTEQSRQVLLRSRRPKQVDLQRDVVPQLLDEHLERRTPAEQAECWVWLW